MNYYKSELHEKLVRTDAERDLAYAKPMDGSGPEFALAKGSPILVDAIMTPISKEQYDNPTPEEDEGIPTRPITPAQSTI
jgi:hypothetical protein